MTIAMQPPALPSASRFQGEAGARVLCPSPLGEPSASAATTSEPQLLVVDSLAGATGRGETGLEGACRALG